MAGLLAALGIIYAIGATRVPLVGVVVVRQPGYTEPVKTIVVATLLWPVVMSFAAAELIADIWWRQRN